MWHHHYPSMHQLVRDRQQQLSTVADHSRLRRELRRHRTDERAVHRPSNPEDRTR